eukprot:RCo049275
MASGDSSEQPKFRFGVIADVQYGDFDDASNFDGDELRSYRSSLQAVREAVRSWNALELNFVAQLGDLIDGQNAGSYGAGLKLGGKPQSGPSDRPGGAAAVPVPHHCAPYWKP